MLINFNQQFRLRTNEPNFINNYHGACYWNLSFNKNWISYRCHEHYFVNFYYSNYWNLLCKIWGLEYTEVWFYTQLSKNETPAYEVISGAAIAFAALLLIIPGFATDALGFLLIFPYSRKMIFKKFSKKFKPKENKKNNFIDGDFEDMEDDNDRKI